MLLNFINCVQLLINLIIINCSCSFCSMCAVNLWNYTPNDHSNCSIIQTNIQIIYITSIRIMAHAFFFSSFLMLLGMKEMWNCIFSFNAIIKIPKWFGFLPTMLRKKFLMIFWIHVYFARTHPAKCSRKVILECEKKITINPTVHIGKCQTLAVTWSW